MFPSPSSLSGPLQQLNMVLQLLLPLTSTLTSINSHIAGKKTIQMVLNMNQTISLLEIQTLYMI